MLEISTWGTVPGWITAISSSAGFGIALTALIRYLLGKRSLSIKANEVNITGDDQLREHWMEEVKSLREQMALSSERARAREQANDERYERALQAADRRHDKCVEDTDALRAQVEDLREEVKGLRAQLAQEAASAIAVFAPRNAPASHAAALRLLDKMD